MTKILITGDNLKVQKIDDEGNIVEDIRESSKFNISDNIPEYYNNGVSTSLYNYEGLQVHKFKPLEDLKREMSQGDAADRYVANRLPKYVLMMTHGVNYNKETAYQLFRNYNNNFIKGYGLFRAYVFGDYYINTITGETTKDPKGYNPYDEWERLKDIEMDPLPEQDIMVAAGGNFSTVYLDPWFVNSSVHPNEDYLTFINKLTEQMKKTAKHHAYLQRTFGTLNPLDKQR